MEEVVKWFALADIPLSAKHANAMNTWFRQNKVSMVKKPRNFLVEGTGQLRPHMRQKRCNYYRQDEAIECLMQETTQKLVLEARPIIMEFLGVKA
jgi:hypothetical protein